MNNSNTDVLDARLVDGTWNTQSPISFWAKPFGKVLRWFAFIPASIVLGSIIRALPLFAVDFAQWYKPQYNFLTVMLACAALSLGWGAIFYWGIGVFYTSFLCANVIAPNRRIGAVILGSLFCLGEVWAVITYVGQGSWFMLAYELIFAVIFMAGVFQAYKASQG